MEIEKILDLLKNPLENNNYLPDNENGKFFLEPILASDGEVYEISELLNWFNKKAGMSPKTGKEISNNFYEIIPLKAFINELMEKNKELAAYQYKRNKLSQQNNFYYMHRTKINGFISTENFSKLVDYTDYSLNLLGLQNVVKIIRSADIEVIKHVIKNCNDLNQPIKDPSHTYNNWGISNLICRYGNSELVKYMIQEEIYLDSVCPDSWCVIHQLCAYCSNEIIKLMLDKDINVIFQITRDNDTALYKICREKDYDLISYIFEKLQAINHKFNLYNRELLFTYVNDNSNINNDDKKKLIDVISLFE